MGCGQSKEKAGFSMESKNAQVMIVVAEGGPNTGAAVHNPNYPVASPNGQMPNNQDFGVVPQTTATTTFNGRTNYPKTPGEKREDMKKELIEDASKHQVYERNYDAQIWNREDEIDNLKNEIEKITEVRL